MVSKESQTPIIYPTRRFVSGLLHGAGSLLQNLDRLPGTRHYVDAVVGGMHNLADDLDPNYPGDEEAGLN